MHLRHVLFLLLCVPLLTHCGITEEQRLKEILAEANVCVRTEDCALIGSKCPFGCAIYVHRDRAEELQVRVEQFTSSCVYDCEQIFDVECRQNRCEPIMMHPAASSPGGTCVTHDQCLLPADFAMRSHCPFATRCMHGQCAVVCPMPDPSSTDGSWGTMRCETDEQCDCSGYASTDLLSCSCIDGGCVGVVK